MSSIVPVTEFGVKVRIPYTPEELNSLNDEQIAFLRKEIRSAASKTVLGQYSGKPGKPTVVSCGARIPAIPGGLSGEQIEQVRISQGSKPALICRV